MTHAAFFLKEEEEAPKSDMDTHKALPLDTDHKKEVGTSSSSLDPANGKAPDTRQVPAPSPEVLRQRDAYWARFKTGQRSQSEVGEANPGGDSLVVAEEETPPLEEALKGTQSLEPTLTLQEEELPPLEALSLEDDKQPLPEKVSEVCEPGEKTGFDEAPCFKFDLFAPQRGCRHFGGSLVNPPNIISGFAVAIVSHRGFHGDL